MMFPDPGYRSAVTVPAEISKQLARIASRLESDRAKRDELIIEAHRRGASLREIAACAGLSHVAVLKIIRAANTPD